MTNIPDKNFWQTLEELLESHPYVIDRPKGSVHPRFSSCVYPVDYGYIPGTTAADGQGIDLFFGSSEVKTIVGILCTFDTLKKDSEMKILYACTEEEIQIILKFLNSGGMRSIFLPRECC